MGRRFHWSHTAYRFLLGLYPHEFRARFASDLEADFGELLRTRGALATWRRVVPDLLQSVPLTHVGARAPPEASPRHGRQRRTSDALIAVRPAARVPPTAESADVHRRHRDHPGLRNRGQQRDLQPGERGAAASAGIRRAGAADADLRGVRGPRKGRGVAAGLRRSHHGPAPVLEHRRVSHDAVRAVRHGRAGTDHRRPCLGLGVPDPGRASGDRPDVRRVGRSAWAGRGGAQSRAVAAALRRRSEHRGAHDDSRPSPLHGRRRHAGGVPIPEARAADQRRARASVDSAGAGRLRAQPARPRHDVQPLGHRPSTRRHDQPARARRHRRARPTSRRELPPHAAGCAQVAHRHRRPARRRDRRGGAAAAAAPARRGRPRAPRRVCERREPRLEPCRHAPA